MMTMMLVITLGLSGAMLNGTIVGGQPTMVETRIVGPLSEEDCETIAAILNRTDDIRAECQLRG